MSGPLRRRMPGMVVLTGVFFIIAASVMLQFYSVSGIAVIARLLILLDGVGVGLLVAGMVIGVFQNDQSASAERPEGETHA